MAVDGRKRDIAIRVMVTAKEQAEIRKSANNGSAMPMSVFDRSGRLSPCWRASPDKPGVYGLTYPKLSKIDKLG